jgi:hypothetical protein
MRYRIENQPDKEVRVYVGGRTMVVPSNEPIPEDEPAVETPK